LLHLALHFLVPLAATGAFFRAQWLRSYMLLMSGMLIDIDHLLATPIYDPGRCSIGFHPLHTILPILLYAALTLHQRTRLVGIGLCLHILLDSVDCYVTNGIWYTP
jgi:uncharacterized protein DUF6122